MLLERIRAKRTQQILQRQPALLTPVEVVPDHVLHKLASGDAARQRGEISDEDAAILTMVLPDICGELLAYRLAARRGV